MEKQEIKKPEVGEIVNREVAYNLFLVNSFLCSEAATDAEQPV